MLTGMIQEKEGIDDAVEIKVWWQLVHPRWLGEGWVCGPTCRGVADRVVGACRHPLPVATTFSMKLEARSPTKKWAHGRWRRKYDRVLQESPRMNGLRCVACMLDSSDSVTCYLIRPHTSPMKQPYYLPHLHMRKLKHRVVKKLALHHTVRKWES